MPHDVTRFADQDDPLVKQFQELRAAYREKRTKVEAIKREAEAARAAAKVASDTLANAYAGGAPAAKVDKLDRADRGAGRGGEGVARADPWRRAGRRRGR